MLCQNIEDSVLLCARSREDNVRLGRVLGMLNSLFLLLQLWVKYVGECGFESEGEWRE